MPFKHMLVNVIFEVVKNIYFCFEAKYFRFYGKKYLKDISIFKIKQGKTEDMALQPLNAFTNKSQKNCSAIFNL